VTLPILLGLVGLMLALIGYSRGNIAAVVIGSLLMADALLFYSLMGPVSALTKQLFHTG
jgi:hypothetical protein